MIKNKQKKQVGLVTGELLKIGLGSHGVKDFKFL
jgi:hypothetical protein